MRIAELSASTGVSVPTIKYYLREGLLPPGRRTARNQATYDRGHAERLRLIRVLREVGDLGIDAIKALVDVIEDPTRPLHEVLGSAHRAVSPVPRPDAADLPERAEVDAFLDELGWHVEPHAPGRDELAEVLAALRALGMDAGTDVLRRYAVAADQLAAEEVAGIPAGTRDEAVRYVVLGTVVLGAALAALRRLAQEHHSSRMRLPAPDGQDPPSP